MTDTDPPVSAKAIKHLRPGDRILLQDGRVATVQMALHNPVIESTAGPVWDVRTDLGLHTANADDKVALA